MYALPQDDENKCYRFDHKDYRKGNNYTLLAIVHTAKNPLNSSVNSFLSTETKRKIRIEVKRKYDNTKRHI